MRRRRRATVLACGLLLCGLGAGCGVPLDDRAEITPGSELPYDLAAAPATEDTLVATGTGPAMVFLLRDDSLVATPRTVDDPADLNGLLGELTAPLSVAETNQGLRRALNDPELVGGVSRTANVATVELDASFDDLTPHEQVLALGQIVFTLTERDEVDRTRFTRDGEPLTVPTASGALTDTAVTRYDYRSLR